MIKSKFSFWVLLPLFAFICFSIITVSAILNEQGPFDSSLNVFVRFFIFSFFAFIFWMLFARELIGKCVIVQFDGDIIIKRSFLGLLEKKTYHISEMDGYSIIDVPSKTGFYEYIYFEKDKKRLMIASEFYHHNYKDVKKYIAQSGMKFLGKTKWNLMDDIERSFGGN